LRQALLNIAENAIQFTPEGGTVTLRTAVANGEALVSITDTGKGIAPEHLPHIFDRFYRANLARTERYAGLGLSIAKRIIDMHHGRIEVDSTPGEGSTFTVYLPLLPEPDNAESE